MAKSFHAMPFGAQIEDGLVRFRLWAPEATRVDVVLEGDALPAAPEADGWFELSTDRIRAGGRYCFRIDGSALVPDPASRFNPADVHGPSEVIDPRAFDWQDGDWKGRPWEEAVLYELHVGAFTQAGTFEGVEKKLDHLAELGVTAVELMPLADFPGRRNWGYDGVLPFAPDSRYGRPEDLKSLVQSAHHKGLMMFLDVVYNHFGPEGNYLHLYAPQFFSLRHRTPWGAAINFDGAQSRTVRDFFIHNALYWLEEYRFDGLRLDAVHAVSDDSRPDILEELAEAVERGPGRERRIHLVLENDRNAAHYLARDAAGNPKFYAAQWNDDIHHALHVLITGESSGYYGDYADDPIRHLGRCLAEGFAYQGERSPYRENAPRGEPSAELPPIAFVSFLQNHDQTGNRAFGERIMSLAEPERIRAALAVLLLTPAPPLLFMGEEWGSTQPFAFFCDFGADFAEKVAAGRRQEFSGMPEFGDPASRERIPDPMDPATFENSRLRWDELDSPEHESWLALYRKLLGLRSRELIPRLRGISRQEKGCTLLSSRALSARWALADGSELRLVANLGDEALTGVELPRDRLLYAMHPEIFEKNHADRLPPWSVVWYLQTSRPAR